MISVKSTSNAFRDKQKDRKTHRFKSPHYEWDVGWSSAKEAKKLKKKLIFIFVDFRKFEKKPRFFIVPSRIIEKYFLPHGRQARTWKRARWHEKVKKVNRYKNKWSILK